MLTVYMLHCCGEDKRSSKLFRTVLVLWAAFFVLNVLAMFIEGFYYLAPENRYYRGPLNVIIRSAHGATCRRSRQNRKGSAITNGKGDFDNESNTDEG